MREKITYERIAENPSIVFKYEAGELLDPTITTFLWDNPTRKNLNMPEDKLFALIVDYKEKEGSFDVQETASFFTPGEEVKTQVINMWARVINKSDLSNYIYEPFVFVPVLMVASGRMQNDFELDTLLLRDTNNFRLIPTEQRDIEIVKTKIKSFYKQFYQLKEYYESNKS